METVDQRRTPRVREVSAAKPLVLHARVITGSGGGPDKTILNSPKYLRGLGYDCICLYLRAPGDRGFQVIQQRAEESYANLETIDDRGAWDWRVVRRAIELCRREKVTIWHGHDYKTNLLGLLVRRWYPMRLVTTVHGWVHRTIRTPIYYALDRWALRHYERVICVSEDLVAACRSLGLPDDRVIHISNAIDADDFSRRNSVAAAKRRLGWSEERSLIGAIGRLAPEKDLGLLIRAIAWLVTEGRDVGLVLAGDGPELPNLEQLIDDLRLRDRVRLLGFQSDLRPIYEALDIYALSSLREGLPNTVLEAMAFGVPVVATQVAGVPTLIDQGTNGLLTPIGDLNKFVSALACLLDDPPLRARFAAAGRATIENHYSFARRMAKVAAVYDKLLSSNASRRDNRS